MNTACKHESGFSTFRDWFGAKFDDERCSRAIEYGFESGAVGLVYDSQTVPLYNEFSNEIWEIVLDECLTIQDVIERQVFETASSFASFMVWNAAIRLASERRFGGQETDDDISDGDV
jgi:hypothetical protein